ncbi:MULTISPECIES: YiiX/YebB-like N1pC/P60 family cysteine hydrolase [Rhodomicrobium]|uniref:YiiX/YebB-like N1pC/P60 family cysteine hydrolase n=1 Tax=Rhodomicrobium TaxID=1068 RepID=UPI000B4AAB5F|nr:MULTISPECIES: YiiX/YebB-like N1pC/P60 family cysteine hydrolase [Rhodomicrobium]
MLRNTLSRRDLLQGFSAISVLGFGTRAALAAPTPSHPRAELFQSGDFLWPAKPGAFIPKFALRSIQPSAEAVAWEEEKRAFIERARTSGTADDKAAADQMEQLTFQDFQRQYFEADRSPEPGSEGLRTRGISPMPAALPEVGHVALIEVDGSGKPWVIEAMPRAKYRYASLYSRFPDGVIRTTYADWIAQHKDYNVWHGRLKEIEAAKRRRIVTEASRFLGKDYWFWSFNLSDESAFYCSKLVWVSVWKAAELALDGDKSFGRKFWVTPKALVYAQGMELLHNPGVYGRE